MIQKQGHWVPYKLKPRDVERRFGTCELLLQRQKRKGFLWGYLKSLVYVDRPRTIDHLKNNIHDAIANIPIDMLRRVDENFNKRLNQCMRDGGRHLTDVIFKTI
ncbi:MOS1T transposase, partial [Pseudoatta argentina]